MERQIVNANILTKRVWVASHFPSRLSRNQVHNHNIQHSVAVISNPQKFSMLKISSHLLLGLVIILLKKGVLLLQDVQHILKLVRQKPEFYSNSQKSIGIMQTPQKLKLSSLIVNEALAFKVLNTPAIQSILNYTQITLPDKIQDLDQRRDAKQTKDLLQKDDHDFKADIELAKS